MALVRYKWNNFGRYVYYTNLLLYVTFLLCLTDYVIYTPSPYDANDILNYARNDTISKNRGLSEELQDAVANHGFSNLGNCDIVRNFVKLERQSSVVVSKMIILILAALHIIKEVVQIIQVNLHNILKFVLML